MKPVFQFVIAAAVAFMLTSCGGGSNSIHPYFGKIPAMMNNYTKGHAKLEANAVDAKNFAEAQKINDEMQTLLEETNTKIDEYMADNSWKKPIPFTGLSGMPYEVQSVDINNASAYILNLKFTIKVNEPIPGVGTIRDFFLYFKAVDLSGNDIPGSKTVAGTATRTPVTAGGTYEVFGGWKANEVLAMDNFASLVQITREEYNRK
jgi:hypothetical protein